MIGAYENNKINIIQSNDINNCINTNLITYKPKNLNIIKILLRLLVIIFAQK